MRFASPEALWLMLLVPFGVLAGVWFRARRRKALQRFAGGPAYEGRFTATVSTHRRVLGQLLLYSALVLFIFALARPQWGTRLEPVTREGIDVAVVLDTSLSMATEDVAPSRLGQAQHAIDSMLQRLDGNRVALITFAGRATVACPLTVDHAAVRLFLGSLQVDEGGVSGSAMADGLELALRTLEAKEPAGNPRDRVVVLFSDGEDHEGEIEPVLERLKQVGVPVFALGTGTARGEPIPMRDRSGVLTGYKKDRQGKVVTSRLDEALLERLALSTDGRYYRSTAGELEMEEIADALNRLETGEIGSTLKTRYEERFQVPLGLGLLALASMTLLGDRPRGAHTDLGRDREAA